MIPISSKLEMKSNILAGHLRLDQRFANTWRHVVPVQLTNVELGCMVTSIWWTIDFHSVYFEVNKLTDI